MGRNVQKAKRRAEKNKWENLDAKYQRVENPVHHSRGEDLNERGGVQTLRGMC